MKPHFLPDSPRRTNSSDAIFVSLSTIWRWGTYPMRGFPRVGGCPRILNDPLVGRCNPNSSLNRVVLPAPLGPITATNSPEPKEKFAPLQTLFSRYPASRFSATIRPGKVFPLFETELAWFTFSKALSLLSMRNLANLSELICQQFLLFIDKLEAFIIKNAVRIRARKFRNSLHFPRCNLGSFK